MMGSPTDHAPTLQVPTPYGFPMEVSLKQEKPHRMKGLLSSSAPRKTKSALSLSGASGDGPAMEEREFSKSYSGLY